MEKVQRKEEIRQVFRNCLGARLQRYQQLEILEVFGTRDSAQAAIADFEVQLRNAEVELKRAQQLHDAGDPAVRKWKVQRSELQLESSRTHLPLAKQGFSRSS